MKGIDDRFDKELKNDNANPLAEEDYVPSSRSSDRNSARFWCALVCGLVLIAGFGGGRAVGQSPADIGDVNLNGLPYELADWDLFGEYLLHGSSVFLIDTAAQTLATDVTRDGAPLTMLDYLYFYRVIAGLAQPVGDSLIVDPYSVVVVQDPIAKTIQFGGPDSLAALWLIISGGASFQFSLDTTSFDFSWVFDGINTRMLIRPRFPSSDSMPRFGKGSPITYFGNGTLIAAGCADYTNTYYYCTLSNTSYPKLAEVHIGEGHNAEFGSNVTLPITLSGVNPNLGFGGFELTIAYDSTLATLLDVTAGQMLSHCQWEYFVYRTGPGLVCDSGSCTEKTVRIVALAETNNGGYQPLCFGDTLAELAVMTFQVTSDSAKECSGVAVRFVWGECSDNNFASILGDSVHISRKVFDPSYGEITAERPFPTYSGTPSSCPGTNILRGIDFYNGAIDIICIDSIDSRGDLNLNALAYEIADWVVYTNYFLYGLPAFSVNVPTQTAASDVNADGWTLTVADLEYLYRIIIGDAVPYPRTRPDSGEVAVFVQDTIAHSLSLDLPNDSLGAVHLIFTGHVVPVEVTIAGMPIAAVSDSVFTRILIAPSFDSINTPIPHFGSGLLLTYTGEGQLVYADATFDGTQITPTEIQGSSGLCCQHRGNVEGWDDPSGTVDIADLTELVDYLFIPAYRTAPACRGEADADGDNAIDIADVTSLVDYLFTGVPLPPCH